MPAPKFNPKPQIGQSQVALMYKAIPIMLPVPLGLEGVPSQQHYGPWKRPIDLANEAMKVTDQVDIKDAYYVLTQWQETYSNPPEYEAPTMTPTPEQIASNVPQEGVREVQKAELERRNADIKASTEKAKRDVQNIIDQKQKFAERQRSIENQKAKLEELRQKLEGKKAYAKVTLQKTIEESQQVKTLKEQANVSARKFVKTTAQEIQKNITDPNITLEEKETLAQKAALETYKSLKGDSSYKKAATNLAVASDDVAKNLGLSEEEQALLKVAARAESNQNMSNAEIYRRLIDSSKVGETQFKVELSLNSQEGLEGFEEIDINQNIISPQISFLNEQSEMLRSFDLPFDLASDKFKSQIFHRIRSTLTAEIERLPEGGTVNNEAIKYALASAGLIYATKVSLAVETSWIGNLLVASGYGPLAGFVQGLTGWNLGIIEFPITAGIEHLAGGITFVGGETSLYFSAGTAGMPVFSQASFAGMEFVGVGGESIAGAELVGFGGESIAGFGVSEVATPIVSEVATGTATTVAGEAAGTAATTTIASAGAGAASGIVIGQVTIPIPVLGAVLGFLAGLVGPKVINWIKDNAKNIGKALIASLGFGIGALLGISAGVGWLFSGIAGAGISLTAASALTGGLPAVQATLSGAFSATASAFGFMWNTFLAGIGTPILTILIGFPVLVVFILIIINSGAYMVPPGSSLINSTNPYIDVQKVASPNGQLDVPQTITYTITVTAKKDTLTGVSFQYDCNAIKKDGNKINCKGLEEIPPAPTSIEPSTPFTFTFTSDYTDTYDFSDSLVTDTFTINAKTVTGGKVSQTGSASICFGDCPLNCFDFSDPAWSQMPDLQSLLMEAAGKLSGTYPNFATKICPAGGPPIKVCYTTSDPAPGSCTDIFAKDVETATCTINFNKCVGTYGSEGPDAALYLLTHESTHHMENLDSNWLTKFKDQVPESEWPICTYGGNDPSESMAEGNALFVAEPVIYTNPCHVSMSNYSQMYPAHYKFAKDVMFAP